MTKMIPVTPDKTHELVTPTDDVLKGILSEVMEQEEHVIAASQTFLHVSGGQLRINKDIVHKNELMVIILDSILLNLLYDCEYNPENPAPPSCYAFGRNEKSLVPHTKITNPPCDNCDSCACNKFGSAERGKGKACKNSRRLAMLVAATMTPEGINFNQNIMNEPVVYMHLPVTSVKGYAVYLNKLAQALQKPPLAVVTNIKVVPDPKSQFKIEFEAVAEVPPAFLTDIVKRYHAVKDSIAFPFPEFKAEVQVEKVVKKRKF
jgi:hypothetical protein